MIPDADFDQTTATIADNFPSFWRRMFINLMREGFNERQSMEILREYIYATSQIEYNNE